MRHEYTTTIADALLFVEMCHGAGHHDVDVEYDPEAPLLAVISDTITVPEIDAFISMCQPGTPSVVGTLKIRDIRAKSKEMEAQGFLFVKPSDSSEVCHVKCNIDAIANYRSVYNEVIAGNVPYPIPFGSNDGRGFIISNTLDFDAFISNVIGHLRYVRGFEVNNDGSHGEGLMIVNIKTAIAAQDLPAINAVVDTRIDFDGETTASIYDDWTPETFVNSVFGRTGDVTAEVGDYSAFYTQPGDNVSTFTNDANYVSTGDNVSGLTNDANYVSTGDNVSGLTNDAGYITDVTSETLNDLSDVVVTTPSDNEVLAYDSGSGNWINQTASGGSSCNTELIAYGSINNDPPASTNLDYPSATPPTLGFSVNATIPVTGLYKISLSIAITSSSDRELSMYHLWVDSVENTDFSRLEMEAKEKNVPEWRHVVILTTLTAGSRSLELRYGPSKDEGDTLFYSGTMIVERILI